MKIVTPHRTLTAVAALAVAAAITAGITSSTTASASAHTTPHTQPQTPAIATAWSAAWNGNDPQALAELFTSNGTYTDLAALASLQGTTQIAAWKAGTDALIANVHITITEAFRDDQHIAIETIYSGQIHGAPHPFAVPATTILEMDGKLIASDRDYYSLATLLKQSGLPADWTPPRA